MKTYILYDISEMTLISCCLIIVKYFQDVYYSVFKTHSYSYS